MVTPPGVSGGMTQAVPDAIASELAARVAAARPLPPAALAVEVDAIRRLARTHGFVPAALVAGCIDEALARGNARVLVGDWLVLLADAVGCGAGDARAASAFAAACSVRLAH
jgi:hypothetical protein